MLTFAERLYIRLHYSHEEEALVSLSNSSAELIAAAALTANLLIDKRIRLDDNQLVVVDPRPTQEPLLDEALARLASLGSIDREDPEWFQNVVDILPLGEKLAGQLTSKGLFQRQEKKGFLGLSKTITFPFKDKALATTFFEPERATMLHGAKPDALTATQIFMAYCWGAERPWKLSRQENKQYEKRWDALFGDYWGWYDKSDPSEPIEGLDTDLRYALADLSISWATVHMTYIMDDAREAREWFF